MTSKKSSPRSGKPKTTVQEKSQLVSSPEESGQSPAPEDNQSITAPVEMANFPIVGIGASAGGLEAFEQFFTNMPAGADCGMAFVLVQHLDPNHKSILTELIKRYTRMEVCEVQDGMKVKPNSTYIIPPNKDMAFLHGRLHLLEMASPRGLRLPIDFFFRSLAQDQRERAICIVLAGTGTDGTLGLKAIKGEGGMAMVQEPATAKYDGMPRSAIATGLVDYILPPNDMPGQLLVYVERAFGKQVLKVAPPAPKVVNLLQKIFVLLRAQTGHDFTYYKQNTIQRRIERRMVVNQIDQIDHYVRYLQQNPLEVETLFKDLLIGVTNFFRDPEAFAALESRALPQLLADKPPGAIIRLWVPGCSTGEEAYSLAILLQEQLDERKVDYKIQFFATDIDTGAIEQARTGLYPDSISADVSPQRLQRFFTLEENHYRIKKSIRDLVVFAEQNVVEDPPFSKLDLISCRNLLIYMGPELQKKALPLFHYALKPDGFLFLGNSETIGEFTDLFAVVDRKWKLYRRKEGLSPHLPMIDFSGSILTEGAAAGLPAEEITGRAKLNLRQVVEQTLLQDYSPACAIVSEKGELFYIHGRTGQYLEPASGEASLNILRMAREGLRLELTAALRKVASQKETVRYDNLSVKTNGETNLVNLIVSPLTRPAPTPGLIMVVFEKGRPKVQPETVPGSELVSDKDQRIAALERELKTKEDHLQTIIEELETSNEELKSTNEELQSTNEEMQSTNEELETSKEELQSVNEELVTVNMELQKKVDELSRANNDMNNLMAATGIATIFVDMRLCIQRFTPTATQVIKLIQSDVGRPIGDIVPNLAYADLEQDLKTVLNTLIPREVEVQTKQGGWYLMRILPYRTLENVIDGAVITFVEISAQKQTQVELQQLSRKLLEARDYAESILTTIRQPLLVLDGELKVKSANRAFYDTFQVKPIETEGRLVYDLADKQWNIPELQQLLENILPQQRTFSDFKLTHLFKTVGKRTVLLNGREIMRAEGKERLILLTIEDITGADKE